MHVLVLIGCREEVVSLAKKMEYYVIYFENKERLKSEAYKLADQTYIIDWMNPMNHSLIVSICKEINNHNTINYVLSFGEKGVILASLVKEELNIIGNNKLAVDIATNKTLMRQKLNEIDFSKVKYCKCSSKSELKINFNKFSTPVIVKPYNGAGSQCISKIRNEHELSLYINNDKTTYPVILEEFLEGEEYSVEAISYNGKHEIIAITKKYTTGNPHFVEIGHKMPADISLENNIEIIRVTKKLLDVIKHSIGPSHTEIMLTKSGPKIIETHTRPGGDFISDLIKLSYGIDLVEETLKAMKCGKLLMKKTKNNHSRVRFIALNQGKVIAIEGMKILNDLSSVYDKKININIGDDIKSVIDSNTRHGYYIISEKNETELNNTYNRIESNLKFTIE